MNVEITNECPICQNTGAKILLRSFETHGKSIIDRERKFEIYECPSCRDVFLGGITIDHDYYKKYYKNDYYTEGGGIISRIWSFLYAHLTRKENIILDYFNNSKEINILDYGCGGGNFLEGLKSSKFIKNGLEINMDGVTLCRKKGLNVYDKEIAEIDFKDKQFDVVTMWHVLEHIYNPVKVLEKINSLLSNNGIFIFQVPNHESLGFKFGKENWFHLDSPRHLNLFCQDSVRCLCEKTGFEIIKIENEYYDYPLDLFWSVRKSPMRFLIFPFYPVFKMMSREHLTFIAKKKI